MQAKKPGLNRAGLHRFSQSTAEGFWLVGGNGRLLEVNKAYEEMSGYTSHELLGVPVIEFDAGDGPGGITAQIARIHDGGSGVFETRHRRKDGSVFDIEMSVTLLAESGGQLVCLCRDITFRKQTEAALRRNVEIQSVVHKIARASAEADSLKELYVTAQSLADALLPTQNFQINLLDEVSQQILVYDSKQANGAFLPQRPVGKGLTEYVARLGVAVHLTPSELKRLGETGEVIPDCDGVLEWMGAPLGDSTGKVFGVVALCLNEKNQHFHPDDIRILSIVAVQLSQAIERKKIEEALRTSEAKFRNLIKALPLPLAIINKAGKHTYVNERFEQFFGYSYEDISTREKWRAAAFPDENYRQWAVKAWKAAVERMVSKARNIEQVEYNITCKNGAVCSVIASCSPLGEDVVATFTDISERRRYEQLLKKTYERRRKNELMNELIQDGAPSKKIVHESAQVMGAKILEPFSCLLIVIDEYQGESGACWQKHMTEYQLLLDSILDVLEDDNRVSWNSQDGIGVLSFGLAAAEISKDKQKKIADQCRSLITIKAPEIKISIGIAEPAANMSALGAQYRQARTAVTAGRKVWPELNTYHYLDLGVFQLLSSFTDENQIVGYIERTLGKLLRYDKRKRAAYMDTLELILMSDNLKANADKLSIHYHTLMFRKHRLEQILEVSFDDYSARLAILNAVHLLKLRKT